MRSQLVIDADAAIRVFSAGRAAELTSTFNLIAPRLLWTESCSVLHRSAARRRVNDGAELRVLDALLAADIQLVDDYDRRAPWDIATLLGWHKTYDAEYLAAARHAGAGIFTLDLQLAEGARRLGVPVVIPG